MSIVIKVGRKKSESEKAGQIGKQINKKKDDEKQ